MGKALLNEPSVNSPYKYMLKWRIVINTIYIKLQERGNTVCALTRGTHCQRKRYPLLNDYHSRWISRNWKRGHLSYGSTLLLRLVDGRVRVWWHINSFHDEDVMGQHTATTCLTHTLYLILIIIHWLIGRSLWKITPDRSKYALLHIACSKRLLKHYPGLPCPMIWTQIQHVWYVIDS
jgi:hypothetical protein